jgi:hypothetical protein
VELAYYLPEDRTPLPPHSPELQPWDPELDGSPDDFVRIEQPKGLRRPRRRDNPPYTRREYWQREDNNKGIQRRVAALFPRFGEEDRHGRRLGVRGAVIRESVRRIQALREEGPLSVVRSRHGFLHSQRPPLEPRLYQSTVLPREGLRSHHWPNLVQTTIPLTEDTSAEARHLKAFRRAEPGRPPPPPTTRELLLNLEVHDFTDWAEEYGLQGIANTTETCYKTRPLAPYFLPTMPAGYRCPPRPAPRDDDKPFIRRTAYMYPVASQDAAKNEMEPYGKVSPHTRRLLQDVNWYNSNPAKTFDKARGYYNTPSAAPLSLPQFYGDYGPDLERLDYYPLGGGGRYPRQRHDYLSEHGHVDSCPDLPVIPTTNEIRTISLREEQDLYRWWRRRPPPTSPPPYPAEHSTPPSCDEGALDHPPQPPAEPPFTPEHHRIPDTPRGSVEATSPRQWYTPTSPQYTPTSPQYTPTSPPHYPASPQYGQQA